MIRQGQKQKIQQSSDTPFDNSTNGFASTDAQAAIEEAKQYTEGFPRAGVRSCYNSTLPNNQWIGPNELLPNTPLLVLPVNTKLNEITWSNQSTNRAFTLKFYKNGKLAGNLFYTMTVTSPNPGYGYISGLNFAFAVGDVVYCYAQTTSAPSDTDLILWISRIV
jgi:hypothetical protein